PHNMAFLQTVFSKNQTLSSNYKIIYDSEALFSLREIERMRLLGKRVSGREERKLINEEMELAKDSLCIVSVSEAESGHFSAYGFKSVYQLGLALDASPTSNCFDTRKNILFVGALQDPSSPNTDSIKWFVKEIFPLIQNNLGDGIELIVVGQTSEETENYITSKSVKILGKVEDLTSLYNSARLFIAPTRFAAGIPHKVHEASAHGLPVVATSLLGKQLGWQHELDILLADEASSFSDQCTRLYCDKELWERLRENALNRIRNESSTAFFSSQLKQIIDYSLSSTSTNGNLNS
ncbi:MAG: glycosyltransferase family 4 protein, partial [Pyrinomonadaceae bacterium]